MCQNHGQCQENKCICTKDFIGQYCEINVRLIQKKPQQMISMELFIVLGFVLVFLLVLMILTCLFYKYAVQRRKQWQQMKSIHLDKIWTIESTSTNIFNNVSTTKEKLSNKDNINGKLKQLDVHASLV
jgi:heme/copper-type cytochrome/quinol oxidase subunit 2